MSLNNFSCVNCDIMEGSAQLVVHEGATLCKGCLYSLKKHGHLPKTKELQKQMRIEAEFETQLDCDC